MPPPQRQVRADYDARTVVVYQAYPPTIADLARNGQAAAAQRLLPPERPYPVPPAIAHSLRIDTCPGVSRGR